jgi:RNA polymerase sigma-70 factor, ECF subfamily
VNTVNSKARTDSELVKAIRNGENDSFKELYHRYYRLLIHFGYMHTHSMDVTRDLVQDLFFNIWKNRNRLDPEKSIKAYLYRSLNNLIINHLKHSSSRTYSYESISDENKIIVDRDLSFEMDFQKALSRMPEKIKNVFLLSRMEGYKYQEIAEICEISVKAVEKRMSKALEYFRKNFTKYF